MERVYLQFHVETHKQKDSGFRTGAACLVCDAERANQYRFGLLWLVTWNFASIGVIMTESLRT